MTMKAFTVFIISILCMAFAPIPSQLNVFDIKRNPVTIESSADTVKVIVFAKTPCCHDCFLKLNNQIKSIDSTFNNISFILLINTFNDFVNIKTQRHYFKELTKIEQIFFDLDIGSSMQRNTVFSKYFVSSTPAVLILYKNKEQYLSLDVLKDSNYTILKQKIIEFLKEN